MELRQQKVVGEFSYIEEIFVSLIRKEGAWSFSLCLDGLHEGVGVVE
jgi:hypothetical protein